VIVRTATLGAGADKQSSFVGTEANADSWIARLPIFLFF